MKKIIIVTILLLISINLYSTPIYIKGEYVNFRDAPDGNIIGELYSGTELEEISQNGEWIKVKVEGWIWKPLTTSDNTEILKHTILKDEVYDVPIKTQVQLDVLIEDTGISEKKIQDLLNHLFIKTIKRTGFKYHNNPTNVYIYAYTTKEKAESQTGQWVGMISKNYDDKKPQTNVSKIQLNSLSLKPIKKFGLSESTRKEIWNKIILIDDRVEKESNAKYPLDGYDITMDDMKNNAALYVKLKKKYKKELASEYGIGAETIDSILSEGLSKGWAMPKWR